MPGRRAPRSGNHRRNDNNTEATPTVWPAHKSAGGAGVCSRRKHGKRLDGSEQMSALALKRVYEPPSVDDGTRILHDQTPNSIMPRGYIARAVRR
jgi:hypothetical protein